MTLYLCTTNGQLSKNLSSLMTRWINTSANSGLVYEKPIKSSSFFAFSVKEENGIRLIFRNYSAIFLWKKKNLPKIALKVDIFELNSAFQRVYVQGHFYKNNIS